MKTRKQIAELAAILATRIHRKPHRIAEDVMLLSRMGAAAETIAVRLCNGDINQDQFEKRKGSIAKRLKEVEETYSVRFGIGGDPRGYVLKMYSQNDKPIFGNTLGGDEEGYGI